MVSVFKGGRERLTEGWGEWRGGERLAISGVEGTPGTTKYRGGGRSKSGAAKN